MAHKDDEAMVAAANVQLAIPDNKPSNTANNDSNGQETNKQASINVTSNVPGKANNNNGNYTATADEWTTVSGKKSTNRNKPMSTSTADTPMLLDSAGETPNNGRSLKLRSEWQTPHKGKRQGSTNKIIFDAWTNYTKLAQALISAEPTTVFTKADGTGKFNGSTGIPDRSAITPEDWMDIDIEHGPKHRITMIIYIQLPADATLEMLKSGTNLRQELQDMNVYVSEHRFATTQIEAIGFISCVVTSDTNLPFTERQLRRDMEAIRPQVRSMIAQVLTNQLEKWDEFANLPYIPAFELKKTTVSYRNLDKEDKKDPKFASCKALEFICAQEDKIPFSLLLSCMRTKQGNWKHGRFLPYRVKNMDPKLFFESIVEQNSFTRSVTRITITQAHHDIMCKGQIVASEIEKHMGDLPAPVLESQCPYDYLKTIVTKADNDKTIPLFPFIQPRFAAGKWAIFVFQGHEAEAVTCLDNTLELIYKASHNHEQVCALGEHFVTPRRYDTRQDFMYLAASARASSTGFLPGGQKFVRHTRKTERRSVTLESVDFPQLPTKHQNGPDGGEPRISYADKTRTLKAPPAPKQPPQPSQDTERIRELEEQVKELLLFKQKMEAMPTTREIWETEGKPTLEAYRGAVEHQNEIFVETANKVERDLDAKISFQATRLVKIEALDINQKIVRVEETICNHAAWHTHIDKEMKSIQSQCKKTSEAVAASTENTNTKLEQQNHMLVMLMSKLDQLVLQTPTQEAPQSSPAAGTSHLVPRTPIAAANPQTNSSQVATVTARTPPRTSDQLNKKPKTELVGTDELNDDMTAASNMFSEDSMEDAVAKGQAQAASAEHGLDSGGNSPLFDQANGTAPTMPKPRPPSTSGRGRGFIQYEAGGRGGRGATGLSRSMSSKSLWSTYSSVSGHSKTSVVNHESNPSVEMDHNPAVTDGMPPPASRKPPSTKPSTESISEPNLA